MEDQAKRALSQYIVEEILKQPQKILQPDTAIISSGLIDSFSLVDLALYVEDQFGVHLDDTELNAGSFDTINELVTLIEKRM